ncbi:MAG: DUF2490 domain-containing protein [Bacteroidales bacterium]|nr:DUF2490 domain-containing protein [Bacteroidales bacterium]MBP3269649.1 DUF2490 domain-containing protein [Bacteroidales bacterium]
MRLRLLRLLLVFLPVVLLSAPAVAQESEDNTFGGWEFFEVNHDFRNSPVFATFYYEHDNYQYKRLECWYTRTTLGVKILPWLKFDVAYDFIREPSWLTHKAVADLTASLKQGGLKVSVRERYQHGWTPETGDQSDVLRSRLKVQYSIPGSRFSPYLAAEVFTWGDQWKKTRHYVACDYDISDAVQFEAYYLYYAFNGIPAEHVLGIGFNFNI